MRSHAVRSVVAVLILLSPALALDGEPRWIVEYFGADVTILRWQGRDDGTVPGRTDLLMSCEGGRRRMRLTTTDKGASRLGGTLAGSVLIGPAPGSGSRDRAVVARFSRQGGTVIQIEDGAGPQGSRLLAVAELLATQPSGLDFLFAVGGQPVALNRLVAYHLPLSFGPGDAAAIRGVIAACSREPAREVR